MCNFLKENQCSILLNICPWVYFCNKEQKWKFKLEGNSCKVKNNNTIPNPDKDFISICTNCHRMIHSGKNEMISPSELKRIIEEKEVYHDLFR